MVIRSKCWSLAAIAGLFTVSLAAPARADFEHFIVPSFFGQPNTTYQFWEGFTTATAGNSPTVMANQSVTPSAYDSTAATDGAFLAGPHIYSFSAATHPAMTVPNPGGGAGWFTTVVLQMDTLGSELDLSSITLTADAGSPVPYSSAVLLHQDISVISFGTSATDEYEFIWNMPGNASTYTLNMAADGPSMSWAGARIDTLATPAPAPEPASLALLAGGALLGLRRRNRAR